MTHTTRLAVAMGSVLELANREPKQCLQDAYETVAGGGCVEIYQEMADYAMVMGAMLDEIESNDQLSWPGCFDYEVAEPFAEFWQKAIKDQARSLDEGKVEIIHNFNHHIGQLAYEFFLDRKTNDEHATFIADIIRKHTGYTQE